MNVTEINFFKTMQAIRWLKGLTLTAIVAVLIFACAWDAYYQLDPCLLCYVQRFNLLLLAAILFIEFADPTPWLHGKILASLRFVLIAAGLGLSAWHIHLYQLPAANGQCLPSFSIMLSYFSWQDILHTLFSSLPPCNQEALSIWGVSWPTWSGLLFLYLIIAWLVELFFQLKLSGILRKLAQ